MGKQNFSKNQLDAFQNPNFQTRESEIYWKNKAFNLLIDYRTRHHKITMVSFALWAYKRGLKRPNNATPFNELFQKATQQGYYQQKGNYYIRID